MDELSKRRRRKEVEREISSMMRDGRLDGVVLRLEAAYRQWRHLVDDAVLEAVVIVLDEAAKGRAIHNVTAFLATVAENRLRRALRHEDRRGEMPDKEEGELSAELDLVDAQRTVEMLKRSMEGWPDSIRVVTGLVLDAVVANLYMSSEDLAEEASQLLGREISADEARTWKSRGLKRLRELLESQKESA